ncbi:MAG: hypothetical protein WD733_24020 [Bryobacterales bacterium]
MIQRSIFAALVVFAFSATRAATVVDSRESVVLEGEQASVVVDLGGGSIVRFQLKESPLNPLVWNNQGPPDEARPMSHFLCLDRWGAPSKAEQANGMPSHGEVTRVRWNLLREPASSGGSIEAEMAAALPLAGLSIKRRIRLAAKQALLTVTEEVTNTNKLGRLYNMVQHPTIGPPFLDAATVVDANAGQGFMQSSPLPNPEEPSVRWPQALRNGQPVDLRHLTDSPDPNVVSFVIDDEYGWVTAVNASHGLLLGYLWKKSDYPWLNIWRHVKDGKPFARGLEFGTTGLHQPFAALLEKGRIFGRPLYNYLDAGQSAERSYVAFLLAVPGGYQGVADVRYESGTITVREKASGRELSIPAGDLFAN